MKELNPVLKIILFLAIIRNGIAIFTELVKLSAPVLYDSTISAYNVIMHIVMVVILVYILKVKRWALTAFFIAQLIGTVACIMIDTNKAATFIIVALALTGFISILLFLKRNGVSGWSLFYGKKDKSNIIPNNKIENDTHYHYDLDTTGKDIIADSASSNTTALEEKIVEDENQLNDIETVISSIPRKEDGSIDYEAMDICQQFEYISVTESKEVAIKDLKKEISIRKREVKKLNHELLSMTGGKRTEQRDVIREKENEIQTMESLLPESYKQQRVLRRNVIIPICIILAIIISISSYTMYSNYREKQDIATYKLSIYKDIRKNGYKDSYGEYTEYLKSPMRKYLIYNYLKFKIEQSLSYNEFASKLGYNNSNLAQELYDALKEKGVNIEKETNSEKFPIWLKESGNFYAISLILNRKSNWNLTGLDEEFGIEPVTTKNDADLIIKIIKQEIKINSLIDISDHIRKDNISILYEAIFHIKELSEKFSEKEFREWLLSDTNNAIKIYNILLDNGINIFDGCDDSESIFLNWIYE